MLSPAAPALLFLALAFEFGFFAFALLAFALLLLAPALLEVLLRVIGSNDGWPGCLAALRGLGR